MRRVTILLMSLGALLGACGACGVGASGASALVPWWHVTSVERPSTLKPGGEGTILVQALNVGDAPTSGQIVITDTLPAGVKVKKVEPAPGEPEPKVGFPGSEGGLGVLEEERFVGSGLGPLQELSSYHACTEPAPREIRCVYEEFYEGFDGVVAPYGLLEMGIAVEVEGGAVGEGSVEVAGGGAHKINIAQPLRVGEAPSFGIERYTFVPEEEGGAVDAQAGSHPFQLTVSLATNQNTNPIAPPALTKDLTFRLPTGFFGNPTPLPQCSEADFTTLKGGDANLCPEDTAIGVATFSFDEAIFGGEQTASVPLFNLVPAHGEPARFGFEYVGVPAVIDTSLRTGGDYGVTATVHNITQLANFQSETVTFWGVPNAHSHEASRGWGCLPGFASGIPCTPLNAAKTPPFLTLPTSCAAPWETTVEGDSWPTKADPAGIRSLPVTYSLQDDSGQAVGLTGCNDLPFPPSIRVAPDVREGSSPSGLTVDVHVPQEVGENPLGLASSSLKDITVVLPKGVTIDPAGAGGLEACSESQIGYLPSESSPPEELHFTPTLPQPFCPDASKIGTVRIKTPLLSNALEGAVYLAAQEENPFRSLLAMYVVAEDPVSGVLVKLPGELSLNQETGQITTTFKDSPQLPFEDAELHFFGGERAPLGTPPQCGSYTTQASFAPWSGDEPINSTSTFDILAGPSGSPCRDPLPFTPNLTAGTTSIQAGGFTPFTMTMGREDGSQNLQGVQLKMPLGMSGTLSTVKLCGEEQANAGTCGPESQIGETIVSVGLGGDPFSVTGGKVYITGPYRGAPFGLSIVNPAKAGPFNLGQVIVRAKIEVNPETAALTITTDNEGPYKIPTMIDGIPLEIKHLNVDINRPDFTFNATNCSPLAITGSLTSTEGATSALQVPYQVTNCAVLAFKPKLEASTSSKTSRASGASLHVKLSYPAGPYDANIAKVKVELPKALPSRLTTLQKACTAAVFESNPAACPAASIVGHATAVTPVLPVPLSGPAYFVSHGGEAFPSLIIVLQGYGVTVHLVGSTFIDKAGITSSTFKAVPDVPVGTFELTLPEGPYSALAANGNLCKKSLTMPTEFVGQNGTLLETTTKIAVTGCGKAKKAKKTSHKKSKGRKRKRKK